MSKKTPKSLGLPLHGGGGSGLKPGRRKQLVDAMRIYVQRGFTLSTVVQKNLLGRTPDYLKKLCRDHGIKFPDYEPVTPIKKRRTKNAIASPNA